MFLKISVIRQSIIGLHFYCRGALHMYDVVKVGIDEELEVPCNEQF